MTLFSMNLFSNLWALWYGIALWPVSEAPRFRNGQIATIATGGASVLIAAAIVYCSRRWRPELPQDHVGYVEDVENEKGYATDEVHPVDLPGKSVV